MNLTIETDQREAFAEELERLVDDYQQLRDLLRQQQQDLLDRDLDGLEERVEAQQTVLRELEPRRKDVREQLADLLGSDETPQLEDLVESLDGTELGQELDRMHGRLKEMIRDVQRLNDENSILLSNRLQAQERLFELFEPSEEPDQTYDRELEGEASEARGSVLFDGSF